jgi:protein subunit release factor A
MYLRVAALTLRLQVVCTVSGIGAFGMLRFESGVHRVQRVI